MKLAASLLILVVSFGILNSNPKNAQEANIEIKRAFNKQNIAPIVIIGSGPAGLTTGIYSARSGIHTVVFTGEKSGGQLTETSYVENWPGILKKLGSEIMQDLRHQCEQFGAKVIDESIVSVDFSGWPFIVEDDSGNKINALSVIIATGSSPKKLGVPNELMYWGKGVSSCAICDSLFFKDLDVVVVGGGDSAIEEAMQLATYAKTVTILVRGNQMRAANRMQEKLRDYQNISVLYNKIVLSVIGDGKSMTGLEIKDVSNDKIEKLNVQGLFLAIGQIPNTGLFSKSLKLTNSGYIELEGRSQRTSVQGVYAAGDVEDSQYRQAVRAAGSGCQAALEAIAWLREIGLTDGVSKRLSPLFFEK